MAEEAIAARLAPLGTEIRPLGRCIGQVLREDIFPERDNPPFDRVCMDGIAIDSQSLARGNRRFIIQATQGAGAPALQLAAPDGAIEVMTGAIVPGGTDCVIPQEEYAEADGTATLNDRATAAPFRNIQRRGEDSTPGLAMLKAGVRLGPPEIAVAASAGLSNLCVSRQPRFMVISTGDELVEPGRPITGYQVRRSNVYSIQAALRARHFEDVHDDHVADDEPQLRERLAGHLRTRDVLILSGGVSKGKFDFVPRALKSLGVREVFHQVAHRPGTHMWFGTSEAGCAVFGLPGNPVATLVCLIRYVVPAVSAAMGARRSAIERIALASPVPAIRAGFACFLPVALQYDAAGARAVPRRTNGPGDFLALTRTDGFV
ncbi:MAG TPA: molybdopterin molybdotransferase MoeA, partial [Steroidobacteraceae bacterium]|nr:molybdopterin molybdotransferase MoeA [Steroidobacteraceae bacterium]